MRQALNYGDVAFKNNEVPVTALLVDNRTGEILHRAHNMTNISLNGTSHAEFQIYNHLLHKSPHDHLQIWKNATLYVTVEPCIMCASLLDQLGISCVVFGCPNVRFGGNGSVFNVNYNSNYKIIPGVGHKEAIALLRRFYVGENKKNPNSITKKKRVLKMDDFPQIEYSKYISREKFVDIWGGDAGRIYDTNDFLEFDDEGKLILNDNSHKRAKI